MEELLRCEEIPEIEEGIFMESIQELPVSVCYDLSRQVLYFPVRHHSPACTFHLKKAVEDYKPECILIEGPQNARELIPVLSHEDTRAPVALYYFYKDQRGLLSEEKEDYKCYYPFLDFSPELEALRQAKARNIPAEFIDLPYGEILLGTAQNRGLRRQGEKQTYNDDYLLSRSRYLKLLCEKTGLRNFDEVWEKYFEIGALSIETKEFVRQLLIYCGLSRKRTSREEMEEDGCLLREQYMAEQIAEASRKYQRILVVTGGFHTWALPELLKEQEGHLICRKKAVKLHNLNEREQGVYPLSYSMEAADALNGYASGMRSPGFYQKVWEGLSEREYPAKAYEEAVLHQLVSAGRRARRKKEAVSSYDVICAFSMAKGLAALRGKTEPGLFELQDGALSAFVKGECNPSSDLPLRLLAELNTGAQVGTLCRDAIRPPLLSDFEEQCGKYGLKIHSSAGAEITLELFTKKRHLALSRFLYQTQFLETGFAQRRKGADLVGRRDRNRLREVWSYRFSGQVLAALVDVSIAGGTVEEAAQTLLAKKFAGSTGSREAARLLAQGFLMGFWKEQAKMALHMRAVLTSDGDFFSLAEGFSHLRMLWELQDLYQVKNVTEMEELIGIAFQKIIQLLPGMAQVKQEQLQGCMECCLSLYQITGKKGFTHFRPALMESFLRLLSHKEPEPGLEGAVLGLLYGYDSAYGSRIGETAAGYLQGTKERQMKSAGFLRGLFFTARDLVFVKDDFLLMIDKLLAGLSGEAFMKLLPELRQAFGYFTPLEIDRIAGRAAGFCGAKKQELLRGRLVSAEEYEYGELLDAFAGSGKEF